MNMYSLLIPSNHHNNYTKWNTRSQKGQKVLIRTYYLKRLRDRLDSWFPTLIRTIFIHSIHSHSLNQIKAGDGPLFISYSSINFFALLMYLPCPCILPFWIAFPLHQILIIHSFLAIYLYVYLLMTFLLHIPLLLQYLALGDLIALRRYNQTARSPYNEAKL